MCILCTISLWIWRQKMKNMEWGVGRIETYCIVSQIGLKLKKVACDFVESREDFLRYLILRLLVIIIKIWGGVIFRTRGDYMPAKQLRYCIDGGWKIFIYLRDVGTYNALVLYNEFKKKRRKNDECGWFQDKFSR